MIDRRLETNGWLSRLHESGKEIHARSIFLQGLLLMQSNQRPKKFGRWKNIWVEWDKWLKQNQVSAIHACLQFILSFPQIDRVIVGVDSLVHLVEIVNALVVIAQILRDLWRVMN